MNALSSIAPTTAMPATPLTCPTPLQGAAPAPDELALATMRDLPALPAAVLELLRLVRRDDIETGTLAAKISLDPALTAKTLRLANSSFYGVPRHVTSVSDATLVLGLRTVRTLVTTAVLAGSFEPPACEGFDFPGFWQHAVSAAVSAKLIATAVGADGDTAFTAALLHDVGQLVLATGFSARFAQVLALRSASEIELVDAEQALLGIDHATLGALLAERWHFPREIVEAIGHHHAPPAIGNAIKLVHIVYVAGTLAHLLGLGKRGAQAMPAACSEVWAGMDMPVGLWDEIAAQTEQQAQAICAALLS
jgi:putative nucleotidyltransferase with HDIG domain